MGRGLQKIRTKANDWFTNSHKKKEQLNLILILVILLANHLMQEELLKEKMHLNIVIMEVK